ATNQDYQKLYTAGNQDTAIFHFTGDDKPCNTLENHPYTALYLNK
ncbi:glycosyltransferase family 8 protein, partial [Enterococcus faecalis]